VIANFRLAIKNSCLVGCSLVTARLIPERHVWSRQGPVGVILYCNRTSDQSCHSQSRSVMLNRVLLNDGYKKFLSWLGTSCRVTSGGVCRDP